MIPNLPLPEINTVRLLGMKSACRAFHSLTKNVYFNGQVYITNEDLGKLKGKPQRRGRGSRGGYEGVCHTHAEKETDPYEGQHNFTFDGHQLGSEGCFSLADILKELALRPHISNKKERAAARKIKAELRKTG